MILFLPLRAMKRSETNYHALKSLVVGVFLNNLSITGIFIQRNNKMIALYI